MSRRSTVAQQHRPSIDLTLEPHHYPREQPAYFVDVIERIRKFPFKGWCTSRYPKDPPIFADGTGSVSRPLNKVSSELPPQCEWVTDWEIVEDEDPEGDVINLPQHSPTTGTKHLPTRVKRDAEGWLYGKDFDNCYTSDAANAHCRLRTHRRVFKFKEGIENTVDVFPPLFRCLIVDEKFSQKDGGVTYQMLRDAGSDDESIVEVSGGRPRSNSVASTALTVPESVMLFKLLPDEFANNCMDNTCGKSFNTFRRRHHCRSCGLIYCGSCAPKRAEFEHVRICNPCNKMDQERKAELVMEISMRNEETQAIRKEPTMSDFSEAPPIGALMKFQFQQNQNLEAKIRGRIMDDEDKSLTALTVQWLEGILPRNEEAEIIDKWEAARRRGGRAGMATLTVSEGMGIDKGSDPTTFLTIIHESRPEMEHRSETVKRSSAPRYNFKQSWAIFDDTKPFVITVWAERSIGRPKAMAVGSFVASRDSSDRKKSVVGTLYFESGMEDLQLKAPVGNAVVPGSLYAEWRIEYRDTMEESGLDFCSICGRVLPHACTCPEDVKAKRDEEKQSQIDEVYAVRAQVTSERLMKEYLDLFPPRPTAGGNTNGEEARALFNIGFDYGMKKYPPPPLPQPKTVHSSSQPLSVVTGHGKAALNAVNGQLNNLSKKVSFSTLAKVATLVAPAHKDALPEDCDQGQQPDNQQKAAIPVIIAEQQTEKGTESTSESITSPNTKALRSRADAEGGKELQRPRRGHRKEETKCCSMM